MKILILTKTVFHHSGTNHPAQFYQIPLQITETQLLQKLVFLRN